MPADAEAAIKGVVAAVESGRLTRKRIQESVAKILAAKERVGLARKRYVNLEAIGDIVDAPESVETANGIAERAVTLVRNEAGVVPLAAPGSACFVVLPETRYTSQGQVFVQDVRKRLPKASIATLDPTMPKEVLDDNIAKLTACDSYAVAAFASVSAYRGAVGLAGDLPYAIEKLIATGKPVILTALGNPYLLRSFPGVKAYLATFSNVPPSETAAVKALFGEMPIRGRLPVSIPGFANYRDGIQLQAAPKATAP
jgi:beta-N-acetylhexosaminidase